MEFQKTSKKYMSIYDYVKLINWVLLVISCWRSSSGNQHTEDFRFSDNFGSDPPPGFICLFINKHQLSSNTNTNKNTNTDPPPGFVCLFTNKHQKLNFFTVMTNCCWIEFKEQLHTPESISTQ